MKNRCILFLLLNFLILSIAGCGMVSQKEYEILEEKYQKYGTRIEEYKAQIKEYKSQINKYEEKIKIFETRDWYDDGKTKIFQQAEAYKAEMDENYKRIIEYVEKNVDTAEQQEILQSIKESYEYYYVKFDHHTTNFFELEDGLCEIHESHNLEDKLYDEKLFALTFANSLIEGDRWGFRVEVTKICPEYEWFYE